MAFPPNDFETLRLEELRFDKINARRITAEAQATTFHDDGERVAHALSFADLGAFVAEVIRVHTVLDERRGLGGRDRIGDRVEREEWHNGWC